jgi:ribonuclease P protein component
MRPHQTLKRTRDFDLVRRQGRRVRGPGMTLYIRRRAVEAPTRLGLAVPRGRGRAVARNRVKRRLRAAAAGALPRRGWDVVIGAHASLDDISFQKIVAGLEGAVTWSARSAP